MNRIDDRDRGYLRLARELDGMHEAWVDVGIQEDSGTDENGTHLAEIAGYNEFGTDTIPERSFLRSTWDEEQGKLGTATERVHAAVMNGRGTVLDGLEKIGMLMATLVKRKIDAMSEPGNAPSTIRQKGADNPLVDTGRMRNSVTHVVDWH